MKVVVVYLFLEKVTDKSVPCGTFLHLICSTIKSRKEIDLDCTIIIDLEVEIDLTVLIVFLCVEIETLFPHCVGKTTLPPTIAHQLIRNYTVMCALISH